MHYNSYPRRKRRRKLVQQSRENVTAAAKPLPPVTMRCALPHSVPTTATVAAGWACRTHPDISNFKQQSFQAGKAVERHSGCPLNLNLVILLFISCETL
jgi:hypothetical protein